MCNTNNIYLGSCLDLLSELKDNTVDLAILDPPYNVKAASWDNIANYLEWLQCIVEESLRVLKPNGSFYLWGMSKNNDFLRLKLWLDETQVKIEFKNWIVWLHKVKIHRKPKDKYLNKHEDLLFYAGKDSTFNLVRDLPPSFQLKMHKGRYDENFFIERHKLPPSQQRIFKNGLQLGSPAKSWWTGPSNISNSKKIKNFAGYKSEWVCERIINVSSSIGDVVLVPFAGTGTECVCAKRLNRSFIASEINKDFYDLATDRVEKTLTNKR